MGERAQPWTEAFVGPRFGFSTVVFVLPAGHVLSAVLPSGVKHPDLVLSLQVAAAALIVVALKAFRPNRLRLGPDGLELTPTWGARRRIAWRDTEPPVLAASKRKGGRDDYVVRCEYLAAPRGRRRTLSMPADLDVCPFSLLVRMNEMRSVALGGRALS